MATEKYLAKLEKNNDTIVAYVAYLSTTDNVIELLKRLHKEGIQILIEGCKSCISNFDRCISETINKAAPSLILIEDDNENYGILLFKRLKQEGSIENIPVVVMGVKDEKLKLKILQLGALDYISDFNSEIVYAKVKNFIEMGRNTINMRTHDKVTGVYSKIHGENIIRKSIAIAKEEKENFSILLIEIDGMNIINEKLEKRIKNELLMQCASVFKEGVSIKDFVYRYGDAQFVLTFRDKTIPEILNSAATLQYEISEISKKISINMSFSGGITSLNSQITEYEDLVKYAFESMIVAKNDGGARSYINDLVPIDESTKNILIISEDQLIKNIMVSKYNNKGYTIYETEDFESSLLILNQNKIALIIIEFQTITLNKNQIIKDIKDINRNIKIIVISSQKSESAMQIILKLRIDEYLQKPFSIIELELRMKKLIG